jgi:hypothetical protein
MPPSLTVQQRAQRCRCGRYLAWWTQPARHLLPRHDPPPKGCLAVNFDVPVDEREGDGCE